MPEKNTPATRPAWGAAGGINLPTDPLKITSGSGEDITEDALATLWSQSGSGARSGRGYHYQDSVGAWLAARAFAGRIDIHRLVSEGLEDYSTEGDEPCFVQVKSRQGRVGNLSAAEAAAKVVESWQGHLRREKLQLGGRLIVVFERPVGGARLTDWAVPVADALPPDHAFITALRANAKTQGLPVAEADRMCSAVSVVVLDWDQATDETVEAIVSRTGLPSGAAIPVLLALRGAVADCADLNAERGWNDCAGLSRTDIETLVQRTVELIDREALESALAGGICEPVDFRTAEAPTGFYEGFDVQPAHLVAGLIQPRPVLTDEIVEALVNSRSALLVGPSGVGKSAVLWSAVHVTRYILWYRVWRLYTEDVEPLLRLARAAGASPRTPVGFVVDAVGRADVQAWDSLQRQVRAMPGLHLLGTARHEDLLPLRSLPDCGQVQVLLDEEVAERIYRELLRTGATTAPHWRHAFEEANGLTLEFTHLLTRGRRLAAVVTDQIQARLDGRRDGELAVLAAASVAHRWGASLPIARLRQHLGLSDATMARVLSRLKDELLLRVEQGCITGLHQLRSEAIAEAVHAAGSPTLIESACVVVGLAQEAQLRPFVAGLLTDVPDSATALLDALAARFEQSASAELLTETLQALRVVDFHRITAAWPEVLERHGVTPARMVSTLRMALWMEAPLVDTRPEIKAAWAEIAAYEMDSYPLRDELLLRLGADRVVDLLLGCRTPLVALGLLGTLAVCPAVVVDDFATRSLMDTLLVQTLRDAKLSDLAAVMSAARSASIRIVDGLFEALGGDAAMVDRFYTAYPWATDVQVTSPSAGPTAVARLMHIADQPGTDLNERAIELGRLLLRCFPRCEVCDITTHLAHGVDFCIGDHPLGGSALQRRYEHGPTDISWNRMRLRIAAASIGATDTAPWLHTAWRLLDDLWPFLDDYLRLWLRGADDARDVGPTVARAQDLVDRSERLAAPIETSRLAAEDVLEQGKLPSTHPLNMLVSGTAANLSLRVLKPDEWRSLVGFVGDTLPGYVEQVRSLSWHLIGASEPPAVLDKIRTALLTLRDVLTALASGEVTLDQLRGSAREGDPHRALRRAAALARAANAAHQQRLALDLDQQLAASGLRTHLHSRWPAGGPRTGRLEHAVTVELDSLVNWPSALEVLVPILAVRRSMTPFLIVPLRHRRPVRELSRQFISSLMSAQDAFEHWAAQLPEPHPTPLASAFSEARDMIRALSAIGEVLHRREELEVHAATAKHMSGRLREVLDSEAVAGSRQSAPLVAQHLLDLMHRLDAELNGLAQGDTVAADHAKGFAGEATVEFEAFAVALLDAYEHDIASTVGP